jgi:hypothetical protein
MVVIIIPALVLGVLALIASLALGSGKSSVSPLTVPPGYRAVSDSYFGYAVPSSWLQNNAYTDDVGDLDSQGPSGWAAEHLGPLSSAPAPGEAPPASFAVFGQARPTPFQISGPTRITVKGAAVAYRYTVTRPQGFQAVAINAWRVDSGAELWLLVHADPATTATVIGSLRG